MTWMTWTKIPKVSTYTGGGTGGWFTGGFFSGPWF